MGSILEGYFVPYQRASLYLDLQQHKHNGLSPKRKGRKAIILCTLSPALSRSTGCQLQGRRPKEPNYDIASMIQRSPVGLNVYSLPGPPQHRALILRTHRTTNFWKRPLWGFKPPQHEEQVDQTIQTSTPTQNKRRSGNRNVKIH